ncbi:inhibitor of the pro-sigma K processing machinery [Fictibacillus macauensis ZFHKF-1]|uniref:Inhibitor of the pro-sigma K processing machinery n=1 Tax=Fictibacillus macauensis ZFHKF-1 TaxID=1196324 RepID=I8UA15_9BACL|nr:pro-sigmaK processing inhibitor BofA family protein [Fictibacillus macauensis]EIT83790.1 inhibitor of the pro-sigma K processing machinery [Fictibacillus macauensis ZFHKF-1]
MQPVTMLAIAGSVLLLFLFIGAPLKPVRLTGRLLIRMAIGAVLLFFLNTAGSSFHVHVPINVATVSVSGILGLPGIASLAAIQYFIL